MKQYTNSANFVHYVRLYGPHGGGGGLDCWLGSTRVNGADAKVQQCQPAFRPTGSSIQLSLLYYYWTWRQKKRTDTVKPTLIHFDKRSDMQEFGVFAIIGWAGEASDSTPDSAAVGRLDFNWRPFLRIC